MRAFLQGLLAVGWVCVLLPGTPADVRAEDDLNSTQISERKKQKPEAEILSEEVSTQPTDEDLEQEQIERFNSGNYRAQIIPYQAGERRIKNLKWISKQPKIVRKRIDDDVVEYSTVVRAYYKHIDWSLTVDGKQITPPKNGRFAFRVKFEGPEKKYNFLAVGPRGQVHRQTVKVTVPRWAEMTKKPEPFDPWGKRHYLSPGLGFSFIKLTDERIGNYWGINLSGKVSYRFRFAPPRWDFGVSSYVTVQNISTSQPDPAHFWGLNFRLGYVTDILEEPWRFDLLFGGYYLTMFVENLTYGFEHLSGPQIFPTVRYKTKSNKLVVTYFKYSLVNQKFGLLSLESREMATGIAYIIPTKLATAMNFSLDISDLVVRVDGVKITVNTATFGIGISF